MGLPLLDSWARHNQRDLSMCSKLPSIFLEQGFEDVHHDMTRSDNDPGTGSEFTAELCQALGDFIVRVAEVQELNSHKGMVESGDSKATLSVDRAKDIKNRMMI